MAKVVVLSGAGLSAQSGIDTFRDSGGLWDEYDPKKVAHKGALENNRAQTLEFYDKRRTELETKEPNHAHEVLSDLKKRYTDDIAIITQNVDDLFEKAGLEKNTDVTHLHGFMTDVRCEKCGYTYDIGYKAIGYDKFDGKCPTCGSKKIRPNIVMFGEAAPNYEKLNLELQDCELLVVIGTSGNVLDVESIAKNIKRSILNNLESSDAIDDSVFSKVLYKEATEAIDEIAADIEALVENKVDTLTSTLYAATVHMLNYDLDGLTFNYDQNADSLYNYLVKLITEVDELSKEQFDQVITNLIIKFKDRRDNRLGQYEKVEDFNSLICFLINDFEYGIYK